MRTEENLTRVFAGSLDRMSIETSIGRSLNDVATRSVTPPSSSIRGFDFLEDGFFARRWKVVCFPVFIMEKTRKEFEVEEVLEKSVSGKRKGLNCAQRTETKGGNYKGRP